MKRSHEDMFLTTHPTLMVLSFDSCSQFTVSLYMRLQYSHIRICRVIAKSMFEFKFKLLQALPLNEILENQRAGVMVSSITRPQRRTIGIRGFLTLELSLFTVAGKLKLQLLDDGARCAVGTKRETPRSIARAMIHGSRGG